MIPASQGRTEQHVTNHCSNQDDAHHGSWVNRFPKRAADDGVRDRAASSGWETAQAEGRCFTRIVRTGTGDDRTTFSATLPRSMRLTPRRPCVPITMRSAFSRPAASRISTAGEPRTRTDCALGRLLIARAITLARLVSAASSTTAATSGGRYDNPAYEYTGRSHA